MPRGSFFRWSRPSRLSRCPVTVADQCSPSRYVCPLPRLGLSDAGRPNGPSWSRYGGRTQSHGGVLSFSSHGFPSLAGLERSARHTSQECAKCPRIASVREIDKLESLPDKNAGRLAKVSGKRHKTVTRTGCRRSPARTLPFWRRVALARRRRPCGVAWDDVLEQSWLT